MKNLRKNKSGISLIVLVITIIVMIILAAAIILSLSNSGIISKANEASFLNDVAAIREKLEVVKNEKILANTDIAFTTAEKNEILGKYINILEITDDGILCLGENATTEQVEQASNVGISYKITPLEDWNYFLEGENIVIYEYVGTGTHVVIPSSYYVPVKDKYYDNNASGTYSVKINFWGTGEYTNFWSTKAGVIKSLEIQKGVTTSELPYGSHGGYFQNSGGGLYMPTTSLENVKLGNIFPMSMGSSVKVMEITSSNLINMNTSGLKNLKLVKITDMPENLSDFYFYNTTNGDISTSNMFEGADGPITIQVPKESDFVGKILEARTENGKSYPKLIFVGY